MGQAVRFRDVLGVREFRALWAAELLSVLGDQFARVALAVLVYNRTSSELLSALTYALTFVPAVLGGALLSGLADRYPRRQVLIVTDLVRAGLAAGMAIPGLPLPGLWALVAVLSVASGPFKAAQLALLPQVLDGEDRYMVGMSVRQATSQSAQLAGFAGGGLLLVVLDPHVALALNAATFAASALLVKVGVRTRPAGRSDARTTKRGPVDAGRQLYPLLGLTCLIGLYVVPEGVAAPYGDAIGAGAVGVGLLMAADPLGSVVGAILAARLRPSPRTTVWFAAASGLPLIVSVVQPGLVPTLVLWAMSGALSTTYLIHLQTFVVKLVPDHRRGAVMGRMATCLYAAQGIAILAGGAAAEFTGVFRAVAGAGLVGALLAVALGRWWRHTRSRNQTHAVDEHVGNDNAGQMSLLRTTGTSSQVSCRAEAPSERDLVEGTHAEPSAGNTGEDIMTARGEESPDREQPPWSVRLWISGWQLWKRPAKGVAFLLGVELAAVIAICMAVTVPVGTHDFVKFGALVAFGLVTAEASRHVERKRRRLAHALHVNLSSVWTMAAALALSPGLGVATAVILYSHMWIRSWRRITGMHPYRIVFSASNVVLSILITSTVAGMVTPHGVDQIANPMGIPWLAAVVLAYSAVNSGLAAGAIALLQTDRSLARLLGSWRENSIEYATLSMGVLTAAVLLWQPTLLVLVLLPLYVLHRSVLLRQFEDAAGTDERTGLLAATSWRSMASSELGRAQRTNTEAALLLIDLDNVAQLTADGTSTSDQVLRNVAETITSQVRDYDLCGRLGGEEFVILLPETGLDDALVVADRIAGRIREIQVPAVTAGEPEFVSVSVGVATYPDAGDSLEDLLIAADNGLFAAKDAGRGQTQAIRIAPTNRRSASR